LKIFCDFPKNWHSGPASVCLSWGHTEFASGFLFYPGRIQSLPDVYVFQNRGTWVWWFTPVISAFWRLLQQEFGFDVSLVNISEFKISLGYKVRLSQ
jgi:hypothetical protein